MNRERRGDRFQRRHQPSLRSPTPSTCRPNVNRLQSQKEVSLLPFVLLYSCLCLSVFLSSICQFNPLLNSVYLYVYRCHDSSSLLYFLPASVSPSCSTAAFLSALSFLVRSSSLPPSLNILIALLVFALIRIPASSISLTLSLYDCPSLSLSISLSLLLQLNNYLYL